MVKLICKICIYFSKVFFKEIVSIWIKNYILLTCNTNFQSVIDFLIGLNLNCESTNKRITLHPTLLIISLEIFWTLIILLYAHPRVINYSYEKFHQYWLRLKKYEPRDRQTVWCLYTPLKLCLQGRGYKIKVIYYLTLYRAAVFHSWPSQTCQV